MWFRIWRETVDPCFLPKPGSPGPQRGIMDFFDAIKGKYQNTTPMLFNTSNSCLGCYVHPYLILVWKSVSRLKICRLNKTKWQSNCSVIEYSMKLSLNFQNSKAPMMRTTMKTMRRTKQVRNRLARKVPWIQLKEKMKDANAAISLQEKCPENNSGFKRDSKPCMTLALPVQCSNNGAIKATRERSNLGSALYVHNLVPRTFSLGPGNKVVMFSRRNTWLKYMNYSMVISVQQ